MWGSEKKGGEKTQQEGYNAIRSMNDKCTRKGKFCEC